MKLRSRPLLRLVLSLPLLLRWLPVSLILIALASGAPSLFRWYLGKLSEPGHAAIFSTAGLVALMALAMFSRIASWAAFEISGMWSAQGLHARMVEGVARTRTTFFDENPSGQLINRLVRDFDEVRSTAVVFLGDSVNATVEIVSTAVVAALVSPWAAGATVPLLFVFGWMQANRAPMIDHVRSMAARATGRVLDRQTDLIEGREIYLLYGKSTELLARLETAFRRYIHASGVTFLIESWSTFWIRLSAEIFSLAVLAFLAVAIERRQIDAALAGVVLSSLFGIAASIGWMDFATSQLARAIPHVRRVFEFADLPSEEAQEGAPTSKAGSVADTPARGGTIAFHRYSMSYRADTPTVLRSFSLTLPLGKHIAIVGRTGSGKTSLIQALLRMVHVHSGDITLDGRSIFAQGLTELRRRFAVVPQAPYLFAGTLRSNLDRSGELGDGALKEALQAVRLNYDLGYALEEGGQNLSLGERQLVCLARAIAVGREIILLDEPTSSLDPETDARIGEVLRQWLKGKTVIAIAHRLDTVRGYDWVVEMADGAVRRQGAPFEILT